MTSEVQNLITILLTRFNIQSSDIFLALSILFIAVCAYYGLQRGIYQGVACAFIALTFCTLLKFVPPHIYAIICILLALIISGKFFGFGVK